MNRPERITLVEVGPRDGLQSQGVTLTVDDRVRYVNLLGETGLQVIEAGAFVSPKWVPQMADSDLVFQRITRKAAVRYPALVPNLQGYQAAIAAGAREVAVFTAASETFNRKNTNVDIAGSIERFKPVLEAARTDNIPVRGYVSTCFGCPYEGEVQPAKVHEVVSLLDGIGIREFSIGDTIGVATPNQMAPVLGPLLERYGASRVALHAHDTRGTALANCVEAWRLGVGIFDGSAGGVGGCPYAPGAAGNVATEDLVYTFDRMGVETGVDLDRLAVASRFLETKLGFALPGRAYRALSGDRKDAS